MAENEMKMLATCLNAIADFCPARNNGKWQDMEIMGKVIVELREAVKYLGRKFPTPTSR
jgi:hypothetical protein